jgi:hypothetical protein
MLRAASGDTPAAQKQRLNALNDLLDVSIAERETAAPAAGPWVEEAISTGTLLGDGAAPLLAKAYAIQALRTRRDAKAMNAALDQARLLAEKPGVPPADLSYVRQTEGVIAGDASRFDEAASAFARARAAVEQPRDDWQRLRLATAEVLYGAYAERASRADALRVAEHGTKRIAELVGAKSLTRAFALTILGQLRYFRADYLGAEHDADAALDILRAWPQRTMDRGRALNVSANSRRILGDFAGARTAYSEAIAQAEKESRDDTLPGRLDGLAQLERRLGNDAAARELFERALGLIAEPTKDRRAMTVLANLGDLALERGDLDVAQQRYDVAIGIAQSVYGPQHEARLRPQQGAALVALRRGNAAEAVQQLREIAIAEKAAYGDDYAPLQFTRCALALAQARNGDFAEAWEGALAAERQRIALLRRIVPLLGGAQALGFKHGLQPCGGLVLALALRTQNQGQVLQAWGVIAAARAIATRLQAQRLAVLREASDADGRARWQRWQTAAQAYADALLFSAGDSKAQVRTQQALATAEAELGEGLRARASLGDDEFDLGAALSALPPQQPLVALVDADAFELAPASNELWPGARRFFAFVQSAGTTRLVDLGNGAAREAEVTRWQRALRTPSGDRAELLAAGAAVKAAIWTPLQLPADARAVRWIADGALFRVNPLALPDGDGYVADRPLELAMLDSERDLAAPPGEGTLPTRLLLVGAPDYGAAPPACAHGLPPLPGAAAELRAVEQQWQVGAVSALLGSAVRKEVLRRELVGADALHLATHLVAIGETCPAGSDAARGASVVRSEGDLASSGNEMALALAGANRWYAERDAAVLLSVPEILALPLQRMRFVVLAACDSGSGPVLAEEGVFGLRRAFRLAGAQAVVMSLWPVDDAASVPWMTRFYAELGQGHGLAASSAMATRAALQQRRERGESTHPYYWAPYIVSGATH